MVKNKQKEFVIYRSEAGVYMGDLEQEKDGRVEMSDVSCLYKWSGAATLNQVALEGVKNPNDCKFSLVVPKMQFSSRWYQIIPCSENAKKNLLGVKKWTFQ